MQPVTFYFVLLLAVLFVSIEALPAVDMQKLNKLQARKPPPSGGQTLPGLPPLPPLPGLTLPTLPALTLPQPPTLPGLSGGKEEEA